MSRAEILTFADQRGFPVDLEHHWRRTGYRTDETLGLILEQAATAWPNRPAIITEAATTTFAELAALSAAVARTLVAAGVTPGQPVAWSLPTGADAVATAAALWRIGAVSCPVVPLYGPDDLRFILRELRPAAVITAAATTRRDHPAELDQVLRDIGHDPAARLVAGGSAPAGWRPFDGAGPGSLPDRVVPSSGPDPCLVLFTSGTESRPKGVVHSVAGMQHELRTTISTWGLTFRDRMLMASPMTHITGLLQGFMIPAKVGAAAVLMGRWDAAQCVDLVERSKATYMAGATPFLRELLVAYASTGADRSSLRQYCCGGAEVPSELIRTADGLGISAYRAWGMTELPTATLPNELDPLELRATTDGPLAPGVEARVVDEEGQDCPGDVEGELLLRGPELMLGYLRADANRTALRDGGWFATGDLGHVTDGRVRITGRKKHIINRGGEKFSVRSIELVVEDHPEVESVAVVAVPGGRLGERVGAMVVARGPALSAADISRHLDSLGVARQKHPEVVAFADHIPTNATGKVDRQQVLSVLRAQLDEPRES